MTSGQCCGRANWMWSAAQVIITLYVVIWLGGFVFDVFGDMKVVNWFVLNGHLVLGLGVLGVFLLIGSLLLAGTTVVQWWGGGVR